MRMTTRLATCVLGPALACGVVGAEETFVFVDSGQTLGDSGSRSVALGDLDGDGGLDAMVANSNQPNTVWTNASMGACCILGGCLETLPGTCQSIGGTFLGGNCLDATCEEPAAIGACCVATGCEQLTKASCTNLGGTWIEAGACTECPAPCPPDLNGDGVVDGQDLTALLAAWGLPCDE